MNIYLDYQATTPLDPIIFSRMEPFFTSDFGNPHSSEHAYGWRAAAAIERATGQLASLLGVGPDEIVFTSGATEANNLVLLGLLGRTKPSPRDRILVSAVEHRSVLSCAQHLSEQGLAKTELIPVDSRGVIDLAWLEDSIDDDVLLVSVMTVNNEVGAIQPIAQISQLCARVGAYLHTDAAQAACSLNLKEVCAGVHFLSLSAHKIYGPKGIGVTFVRRDTRAALRPVIHGGGQQGGLRSGTLPVPLCVGFGEAAELLLKNGAFERSRISALRNQLATGLLELLPDARINGPAWDVRHPGNINIQIPRVDAQALLGALQPSIAASSGSACTSGMQEPSHVLRAMGLTAAEADSSIRLSLGRFTSEAEIQTVVPEIAAAANHLRDL